MGLLLLGSVDDDVQVVLKIADRIATLWNQYCADHHAFEVRVGRAQVASCCAKGCTLLDKYLANKSIPGPFKRIAALVVLGQMYPFFSFTASPRNGSRVQWISRFCAFLIPAALAKLRVNVSSAKNPQTEPVWVNTDRWIGFPSPHFKVDFLGWLGWIDNWNHIQSEISLSHSSSLLSEWTRVREEREARIVLSAALMIESCYYLSELNPGAPAAGHIRDKCRQKLFEHENLTSLTYDYELIAAMKKAGAI